MWVNAFSWLLLLSTVSKVYQRTVNSGLVAGYPLQSEIQFFIHTFWGLSTRLFTFSALLPTKFRRYSHSYPQTVDKNVVIFLQEW